MTESLEAQIQIYRSQIEALLRRGRELRKALVEDPGGITAVASVRVWQEHCGVAINQLSGGSKTHWLARSFSEAFLMRGASGEAMEGAPPEKIVDRLLRVLEQAAASLTRKDGEPILATTSSEPTSTTRRFDFVHNSELRPILEQAYSEGRGALEQGEYDLALRTYCGILETIVTDALEHKGLRELTTFGAPPDQIAAWPFETRLVVAEKAGLIRGGCARLPVVARTYRDQAEDVAAGAVSEKDAQRTGQVLNVIMRDLNPGR